MEYVKEKHSKGWLITAVALMLFAVCLTAAVSFALVHNRKAQQSIERTYEQNLLDLGDNLQNIEVNLSKLMVAPDGQYAALLLTDVYSEARAAEKALSALPVDWHTSEETAHFLNRIADFAVSYQRTLLGGARGSGFADNVENMYVAARELGAQVNDSVSLVAQNKLDIRKSIISAPYTLRSDNTIQHNAVEYPELIYDGPFSDGRADDCYCYFEGAASVTLQEAKEIALAAFPEWQNVTVQSAGKSDKEPFFELTLSSDAGEAYLSISERGGKIVNLSVARPVGAVMLGETSAKACAQAFAESLGYDVQPVWYQSVGDAAYVNLAPIIDDVVLYTDLVKVKVALDNGEALGLEAKNYCLNHAERELRLTMNRAAVPTLIDSRLQIENVRGALIPLENNKSRLCYEAACSYKGLDYFVYLDASTGETVQIMRVIDGDQGSLVM